MDKNQPKAIPKQEQLITTCMYSLNKNHKITQIISVKQLTILSLFLHQIMNQKGNKNTCTTTNKIKSTNHSSKDFCCSRACGYKSSTIFLLNIQTKPKQNTLNYTHSPTTEQMIFGSTHQYITMERHIWLQNSSPFKQNFKI